MKRNHFISAVLATTPLFAWLKTKATDPLQAGKGFKVPAGQARFGTER